MHIGILDLYIEFRYIQARSKVDAKDLNDRSLGFLFTHTLNRAADSRLESAGPLVLVRRFAEHIRSADQDGPQPCEDDAAPIATEAIFERVAVLRSLVEAR